MDYYERKRRAFSMIDDMLREDKTIEQIEFKVSTIFGFGKKIVNDRMEMHKNVL